MATEKELREMFNSFDRKSMVMEVLLFLSNTTALQNDFGFFNLVRIIGIDATLKLIVAYSGKPLYVPAISNIIVSANAVGALTDYLDGMAAADVIKKWKKHKINKQVLEYMIQAFDTFMKSRQKLAEKCSSLHDELIDAG